MAHRYQAVGWNRQKKIYDRTLLAGVVLYLALFLGLGFLFHPSATPETLLIRALGTAAFLLLHLILSIGPLCRLDRRFLPFLYNRRHLGVTMFLLALGHGVLSLIQFHASGDLHPLVSLLVSNPRYDSLAQFPFQPLGLLALLILLLMAATSHDFWLANLTAPVWKALHMLVYGAYALLVMHVTLGVLQAETNPLFLAVMALGLAWVLGLHLAAARRERRLDRRRGGGAADGYLDACAVAEIPEGRARVVHLGADRIAVFRYGGRISALSNACQHQNGPLGEGRIIDGCITCPWHGYQYLPASGVSPPPFTEKIPTFRVRVQDGRVLIDPRPLPPGTAVEPALVDEPAPAAEPAGAAGDPEFYVGYLPQAPARLAAETRKRVAVVLLGSSALAALLTVSQSPFSTAVHEFGRVRELHGWILEHPYPSLAVARPAGGYSRYLLVSPGKHGAAAAVRGWSGRHVRLQGSLIYRDDQTMVELLDDSLVETAAPAAAPPASAGEDLGVHTFAGEIVDSKCFLGVMKPGNLKPHRSCASLCISGGVPPVLLVRDRNGRAQYLLLAAAGGGPLHQEVLQFVAEPLEITGRVLRFDNQLALMADPQSYTRY